MFSANTNNLTNTNQEASVVQPISGTSANNMGMEIDTVPQDVEMEENPAAKIKVDFECRGDLEQNAVQFSLHFKTQDTAPQTVAVANDLLNFLLTPDLTRGIFSRASRESKFCKARQGYYDGKVGYYFDPGYSHKYESVVYDIAQRGEATIAFGNVPHYGCPGDTPFGLIVMLSMLDDAIYVMKNMGCDINFTIVDIIKKLAEACAFNRIKFGLPQYQRDNNLNTLQQLISLIERHPNLSHDNAILLCWSFALLNNDHFLEHIESYLQQDNTIDYIKLIDSVCTSMMSCKYRKDDKLSRTVDGVLERLNLSNKIKLFRPALGCRADDGGLYSWCYTEWEFLRDAKFELDAANRMIIDVREENARALPSEWAYNKNSGYIYYYAAGKPNHAIFSQEMKGLEVLTETGLAFEPESDTLNMHDKIVFTRDCSEKLRAMQLHIDITEVKEQVKTRNNLRFLQQSSSTGFIKEYLPEDIIKKIAPFFVFKAEERKLSEEERKERDEEAERYCGRW